MHGSVLMYIVCNVYIVHHMSWHEGNTQEIYLTSLGLEPRILLLFTTAPKLHPQVLHGWEVHLW